MIKRILWILLLACFLTGCSPQSAVPTVKAQETPVPTTEPTAQQFESESLTEATPVLEAKQTEITEEAEPVMKLKKPISLFVNERVNYNHNIEVSDYSHYEMRVDDSKVKYDTPGTYEVLATAVDDYRNQSELKIPVTIKEADLTLSETNISMEIGQTKQLQANTESTSVITYSSSDENVAKISRDGMITAVGKGTCIISASVNGKRVQCYVTVTDISDTVVTPTAPTENETDEHQ